MAGVPPPQAAPPPGPAHIVITGDDLPPMNPIFAWGDTCKDSKDKVAIITNNNAAGVEPWFVKCMRLLYPGYNPTCSGYNESNNATKADADGLGGGNDFIKIEHTINRLESPLLPGSRLPEGITHAFRDSGPDARKFKPFIAGSEITYVYNPSEYTDPASRSAVDAVPGVFFPPVGNTIEIGGALFNKIFTPGIINWFKARINADGSCDIRFMLTIAGISKTYGTHIIGTRSDAQGRPNPSKKNTWPAFTPYPPYAAAASNFPFPGDDATLVDGSKCFIGNGEKNAYFNRIAYDPISDDTKHMLCAILIGKEVFGDTAIGLFAYLYGSRNAAVFTSDYMLTAECLTWYVNSVTTSFDRVKGTSKSKATIFVPSSPELLAAGIAAAKVRAEISSKRQTITDIIRWNTTLRNRVAAAIAPRQGLTNIKDRSGQLFGSFTDETRAILTDTIAIIDSLLLQFQQYTLNDADTVMSISEFQRTYNKFKLQPVITDVRGNDVIFSVSVCNPFKYVQEIVPVGHRFRNENWGGASRTFLSYIRNTREAIPLLRTVIRTDIIAAAETTSASLKRENDEDETDRAIHPTETRRSQEVVEGGARTKLRHQPFNKMKYINLQKEDKYDIEIITELDPSILLKIIIEMFIETIYIDDIYDTLYYLFDIEGEICFKPTIIRELIIYMITDNTDIFDKYKSLINRYPNIISMKQKVKKLHTPEKNNTREVLLRELLKQAKINKNLPMIKNLERQLRLIPQVRGGQRKTRRSKRPGKKQTRKI